MVGGAGGGGYVRTHLLLALANLTMDHESLSRRSTGVLVRKHSSARRTFTVRVREAQTNKLYNGWKQKRMLYPSLSFLSCLLPGMRIPFPPPISPTPPSPLKES